MKRREQSFSLAESRTWVGLRRKQEETCPSIFLRRTESDPLEEQRTASCPAIRYEDTMRKSRDCSEADSDVWLAEDEV
jgi:ferredoxin-thioredoxin reductase catalytic subunit